MLLDITATPVLLPVATFVPQSTSRQLAWIPMNPTAPNISPSYTFEFCTVACHKCFLFTVFMNIFPLCQIVFLSPLAFQSMI